MIMKYICYIFSFIAFVVSVMAICISAYRSFELSFDYQGVIVAVLSLITAVLLGWQIYQVIYIDKIVQHKMEKSISSMMIW